MVEHEVSNNLNIEKFPHEEKLYQHIEEKRKVASKAAKLIPGWRNYFPLDRGPLLKF